MTTIKSVKSLTFISVVCLDSYGCPEPQWCNHSHERCFKILPVYQEDRFGVPVEVLRYETKYPKMDNIKSAYVVDPSVPF